jgi:glycosyltransferase involved in cell wall biosynthesis
MPHDLVVLSHLRWVFVWQRPQQLISRLAHRFEQVWFVEEPWATWVAAPTLRTEEHRHVTRVWLDVPGEYQWHVPFTDPRAEEYPALVADVVGDDLGRVVWMYSPMALRVVRSLERSLLVYDVMDDLASFAKAPPELRGLQEELLAEADVIFTGGRSLQAGITARRRDAHLFPSGVDPRDYAAARRPRPGAGGRPVAGYVGVIDERLDLDLIAAVAAELEDWEIRMVGPVIEKIDPRSVPQAPNIVYTGMQPYEALPGHLREFEVALMPFALNEATRSISPTKTLEYFAAGVPVVSTRVPDVVAEYDGLVAFADDAGGFAAACRRLLTEPSRDYEARVAPILARQHWQAIADRMAELIEAAR